MRPFQKLVDNIESSLTPYNKAGTGFVVIDCPVCGGKKKAGFKFEDDSIGFNCFKGKCPVGTAKYTENGYLSSKFREVLDNLGVEIPYELIVSNNSHKPVSFDLNLYTPHEYEEFILPYDIRLEPVDGHTSVENYIKSRHIEDMGLFRVSTGSSYNGWLAIPFYYNEMLIGIQLLDVTNKYKPKTLGNEGLLYLPHGKLPKEPIVQEGVFDALSVPNGIGTLSSNITKKQAYILRNKKPILLPDRSGSRYIKSAKMYNWRLSIPKWSVKDSNEYLIEYGKFCVAREVYSGIIDSLAKAELEYELWRKH